MSRDVLSPEEFESLLTDQSNWGRWGAEDEVGAVNLITPAKRIAAAALVRSGRVVSLSRPFPKTPTKHGQPGYGQPAAGHHYMMRWGDDFEGSCVDYLGIVFHSYPTTHIDALCHGWYGGRGVWNGKQPADAVSFEGCRWGGIEHWKDGLITRGVFIDVPKHRNEPWVSHERPIYGWELEEIAAAQGVTVEPGDALLVYGGRENWDRANPRWGTDMERRPGLHASCLAFIREADCSTLVWDMMDARPSEYGGYPVHAGLSAFGLALVDNALLEPLAEACVAEGRYEFLLTINPLLVPGGTGSPVNPIAVF